MMQWKSAWERGVGGTGGVVLYPELCFPDLTHAVVPEESKEKLTELLGKETYAQLLESQNARLNIQPGILKLLKSSFVKSCTPLE